MCQSECAPSVDFRVLDRARLLLNFLRVTYDDSITAVGYAGQIRGVSDVAFDPIFRWLQNAVIPQDLALPACLQPHTMCVYRRFCGRRTFFQVTHACHRSCVSYA